MASRTRQFRTHRKAQEAVVDAEHWYRDSPAILSNDFTARKTALRHEMVLDILLRAQKRAERSGNRGLAKDYERLHARLEECRSGHRCGSQACPKCARAFQQAKTATQSKLIETLQGSKAGKPLVMVTIVPRGMTYRPGEFCEINVTKASRWLKDTMSQAGINRIMFGSVDLGWEDRRGGSYIQVHWHLATLTKYPRRLEGKLKSRIQRARKYERPIDVRITHDEGVLPYINKVIKLPDLLRRARRQLPELLLALDQFDPLDFMVVRKLKLSAQSDGFSIGRIQNNRAKLRLRSRNEKT